MKTHRRVRGKGFTLVELLVVIAIIGILVAIVMPAVNNALFRGRLMAASADGRSIIQTIFARDTEQIYRATTQAWPRLGDFNVTPPAFHFPDSTEYFRYLVTNEFLNVGASFFAAPGVPSAERMDPNIGSGTLFSSTNNAWCVVAFINDSYPETSPALFTRNLNISAMDDRIDPGTGRRPVVEQLDSSMAPFGNRGLVATTKGGASFALYRDDLEYQFFTDLFRQTDADGNMLTNSVLRP